MKNIKYIIVVSALMFSCQGLFDKSKREIPKEDLIPILVDLHKADALFNLKAVQDSFGKENGKYYYDALIEKHGYTRARLEFTLGKLADVEEKLEKLYDEVVFELKKQQDIEKQRQEKAQAEKEVSILPEEYRKEYHLPKDGAQNRIEMDIPAKGPGKYIVEADISLNKDDESDAPHMSMYFYNKNSGEKSTIKKVSLQKSGKQLKQSIEMELVDLKYTHLKVCILDHNDKNGDWKKSAQVKNILLKKLAPKMMLERDVLQ